jgi:LPXTG-motif cell wall-anchored protein
MWTRAIVGAALVLVGALWFAQGVGVAKGSPMTGHAQWAWIGGLGIVVGLGLILWAVLSRRRPES